MLRKILSFIAAALWGAFVVCYWQAYVPLRPDRSLSFENNMEPIGWTAEGDAVMCPTLNWSDVVSNNPCFGPVQVWRFPDGRLIRKFFTPGHVLQIRDFLRTGEVSGVSNGEWSLLNASTGDTVERIPVTDVVDSSRRIPGSSLLVYSEGNFVRCYDTDRDALLWSAEGFHKVYDSAGPDFVLVGRAVREPQGWNASGREVPLSLQDGRPLSRFDHLGEISWIVPSPDGRSAAVFLAGQKQFAMCDAVTGATRWSAAYSSLPNSARFDPEGRTFRAVGRGSNGERVAHAWNVEDGAPLDLAATDSPPPQGLVQNRVKFQAEDPNVGVEAAVYRFVRKTPFADLLLRRSNRTWLIDAATSRNLGIIATGRKFVLRTPKEDGFVVFAGKHVDYFHLPPTRNWRWLVLWSLMPPALDWLMLKAIRRLRRPRPAT